MLCITNQRVCDREKNNFGQKRAIQTGIGLLATSVSSRYYPQTREFAQRFGLARGRSASTMEQEAITSYIPNGPIRVLRTSKSDQNGRICGRTRIIGNIGIRTMHNFVLSVVAVIFTSTACAADTATQPGVVSSEFIFEKAPSPECHASTIAEAKDGLVAAWFGGTEERNPDVGIWVSCRVADKWSTPREVASGVESSGKRFPCWNPVLFQPSKGPLMLFYKVGPSPSQWWGFVMTSTDSGRTWSKPRKLSEGIVGPIKNKPVELPNGDIVSPSSTEDQGWRVHFERSSDLGRTWQTTGPLNDGRKVAAIQPAILLHAENRLQAIGRTQQGKLFSIESTDGGKTWGEMALLNVPNPNSGIDAVTLRDGRHLMVYNNTPSGRTPLSVAFSKDGKTWTPVATLENSWAEFSYPAVIQAADGLVHITYTWDRKRIKHVVFDPSKTP